ncbi:MAG TPA: glycosyltransferase, partial [Gemmatimonadaceae bacterium]|nr:glycosyltransferase [Gemmatimonadaceae bacterium]
RDSGGGADRAARELHQAFVAAGQDAWFAAGEVHAPDARSLVIPNRAMRSPWARAWMRAADVLPARGASFHVAKLMRETLAGPARAWRRRRGFEDFDHPGTRALLGLAPRVPDVVLLHNLHGGYFDLRELPAISARVPTLLMLHDAWLLSGHCSHSLSCDRWETGCGECPALWIHPAVPRDRTAANWRTKRDLYARSHLHVVVPCEWLAARVRRSVLAAGVAELRVVPLGVRLDVFAPGDREAAKAALGLDPRRAVALTSGASLRAGTWRDAEAFRNALARLGGVAREAQWIALGDAGAPAFLGGLAVERRAAETDPARMALWYRAADVYVHPARADTFPLMVLESLACGTPVIASGVGGIPEQVTSSSALGGARGPASLDGATGAIVRAFDGPALAAAINAFFALPPAARGALGVNAARDARLRFDIRRVADEYLRWMRELADPKRT